jgi:flagellar hook-basal body complex protein FliE
MSIESIAAVNVASPEIASLSTLGPPQAGNAFQTLLSSLTQVNGQLNAAEQGLQSLAVGNMDNLHQSMMSMERVKLQMQLLLAVRGHALDAYQELMRMQM